MNSASVTFEASVTGSLSACATSLISYFKVCGLSTTLTAVGSVASLPFPLASAPSLSMAFTKRHPKAIPGGFSPLVTSFNLASVNVPSGAGVPVYVITAGLSAVTVVSEVNLFAVNPY